LFLEVGTGYPLSGAERTKYTPEMAARYTSEMAMKNLENITTITILFLTTVVQQI